MKLYCGFKLPDVITEQVKELMVTLPKELLGPLELAPLDRLHVTTVFIGEWSLHDAKEILHAAWQLPSFDVILGHPDGFPNGVLHLGIDAPGAKLVRNAQAVAYLQRTGKAVWPEVYQPHLALAKTVEGSGRGLSPDQRNARLAAISDALNGCCQHIMKDVHHDLIGAQFKVHTIGLYHKSELIDELELRQ